MSDRPPHPEGRPDADPLDEGVLEELRDRLDALQSSVERLGTEAEPPPAQPRYPTPAAISASIATLDAGPFRNLIELREFEETLAGLEPVRDVRVRRFGHRRAKLEINMTGAHALIRELQRLGRPMRVEQGPGGEVVVQLPGPELGMAEPDNRSRSPHGTSVPAGIPSVSLEPDSGLPTGDPVNSVAAQLLPEQVCRHFRMIPVGYDGESLTLAMADPSDTMARDVAFALNRDPLNVVAAPPHQMDRAIDRVWGGLRHRDGAAASVAAPGRLGEILIRRGLIDEDELRAALEHQEREGSRLGEILHYEMGLGEEALASALADQLGVPLVDLEGIEPSPEALAVIPEALQREGRCVPLAVDGTALYVATTDPLDDGTYEAIRGLTDLRIRTYMVTRSDLDALLREIHLEEHVRAARTELLTRFPEDCANRVLPRGRRVFFPLLLAVVLTGFVLAPLQTGIALVMLGVTIYMLASLYRCKLSYESFGRRREFDFTPEEVATVDDREVPRYTILVPLFREAAVVPSLTENLTRLDYPRSKLEIMLLCEEEDDETIAAILGAKLPPYFRILIVPGSELGTKPKACNYGIQQATGKFVVIYDAEDQPDPDQLKKVLLAWQRSEGNVVCVQSRFNHSNTGQRRLTRFFGPEYALWFDLLLPGHGASRAPLPLGGTSNHFNRDVLIELGAWDRPNVAEDADLGLRLHEAGYRTVMLRAGAG